MSSPNYHHLAHLKIPLQDILSATNNFSDANIIGKRRLAKRYKGQLLRSGELIDISARRFNKEYKDSDKLFWTEVSMLSSLRHQNLISFVGFCDENGEKIVISKHETRGRLDEYLSDSFLLTWIQRLKISVGLAHALNYIHYDEPRDFSIIHRNINSTTVLLNDSWEPKLSEFTLSKTITASQRHDSFKKSDMYSFGIVLFELLCGRKSAPLAITHHREKRLNEIIDWDLWKQMDSASFGIFAEIAYDCLNEERSQRPNIDDIASRLENALELARQNLPIMSSPKDDHAHLKIPLEYIKPTTNHLGRIIQITNLGNIHKGQFFWSGELINISARKIKKERKQAEQEFWMEISMLASLKHKNLVSLVGFCDEKDEKVIINRNETKGWLAAHLSNSML